ncbi:hypothetical protein QE435_000078 [Rhizobium sp. SORGH_AS 787]|nr:hypothetical protein [Rhizobium sp. SORGH_AS_0787]
MTCYQANAPLHKRAIASPSPRLHASLKADDLGLAQKVYCLTLVRILMAVARFAAAPRVA